MIMVNRARDVQKSLIGRLPDMAKSMLVLSLGGVFMAEETLRKATRDLKLPREAVDLILAQGERGKKELFDAIAREVGKALRDLDLDKLARRFFKDFEIDIEAHLSVKPRARPGKGGKTARGRSRPKRRFRITTE